MNTNCFEILNKNKEIINEYKKKKQSIRKKLKSFKNLGEDEMYKEYIFCILTPQSNAQKCWNAVEKITEIKNPSEREINVILKSRTRFHNVKSKRVIVAKNSFKLLLPLFKNKNILELRKKIKDITNGYGLKESSHFLRNIGLSDNKVSILDRHILKNMKENGLIQEIKLKNDKDYLKIENIYLDWARQIKIPADELDLLLWSKENGEIFK